MGGVYVIDQIIHLNSLFFTLIVNIIAHVVNTKFQFF